MANQELNAEADRNFEASLPIISYNQDKYNDSHTLDQVLNENDPDMIYWIDFKSIAQNDQIERICNRIGLHHLMIEDILNPNQNVKMDPYDDCLFLVLKKIEFNKDDLSIDTEHVSIVLKGNLVLSFQESGTDIFAGIKTDLQNGKKSIRKYGPDFLGYEMIDVIVDNYFTVLDYVGDTTDDTEEELIANPSKKTLQQIYFIKRELMYLRKSVFPLRELIGQLTRCQTQMINENTIVYLRDVYDHLIQIVDTIETYQDIMSNMLDTYLSSIGNRTNEIMKILAIMSTIFIPLTFLAGIYGMNFRNIPELNFQYGYLMFWGIAIAITLAMIAFFHKKKWF